MGTRKSSGVGWWRETSRYLRLFKWGPVTILNGLDSDAAILNCVFWADFEVVVSAAATPWTQWPSAGPEGGSPPAYWNLA